MINNFLIVYILGILIGNILFYYTTVDVYAQDIVKSLKKSFSGLFESNSPDSIIFIAKSDSMIPTFNKGDSVIVSKKIPFEKIIINDTIAFFRPAEHDEVIIHRVFEILNETEKIIVTKGDANDGLIPGTDFPIKKEDYIGKVMDIKKFRPEF